MTAHFFDRTGAHVKTARGDILIGADGIHSRVREMLFPDEGPPCWNGLMLWRGARDWPVFLTGSSMIVAGGLNAKVVVYPIAEGSSPASRLTNWAVLVKVGDGNAPPPRREDWSRPGKREELMPHVDAVLGAACRRPQPDLGDAGILRISVLRPRSAAVLVLRAGSRCSATPRIRCIRSDRTARRRRSSMRARSPMHWRAPSIRARRWWPTSRSGCR